MGYVQLANDLIACACESCGFVWGHDPEQPVVPVDDHHDADTVVHEAVGVGDAAKLEHALHRGLCPHVVSVDNNGF
jgi:hypothetical protein